MVKNTLTENSSIVKHNILAHYGKQSGIDLTDISSGGSLQTAVVANLFIVIGLILFFAEFKQRNEHLVQENVYKLLANESSKSQQKESA